MEAVVLVDPGCIFCRIVCGDIPSAQVYEDEEFVAFRDIAPAAPVHILIVPRQHVASIDDLGPSDAAFVGRLVLVAAQIARDEGIAGDGYRLGTNVGKLGGQSVFHLHFHLLGGRQMGQF
ncbi:MAG TPA: histidine triad nucleotide-binding protein [Thermomicrobiales bacterium]|nr:histidine triad nucleotide-binding protein [Chloroflexota bacterium]HBY47297.1 histidine triad nucleotide-binding protein [Chloroflexota bacterium]HCG30269.1 histidine triad nucleotide-binding protein [Chloroflexota bacterium]HQZ88742.1 histidine triad nucleotide-binding protein [Thermomicrobiales bacterium]